MREQDRRTCGASGREEATSRPSRAQLAIPLAAWVMLTASVAAGQTNHFRQNVSLGSTTATSPRPDVAVDISGDVYVAWTDNDGTTDRIVLAKLSGDLLLVVGPCVVSDGSSNGRRHPSIAVNDGSDVFVVWEDDGSGAAPHVAFDRALAPVGCNDFGTDTSLDLAWDESTNPDIAATGDTLFVVYEAYGGSGISSVRSRRSTNAGSSWDSELGVGDGLANELHPAVAVCDSGEACVAWEDHEVPSDAAEIFGNRSNGDGSSFGIEFSITSGLSEDQVRPVIATDGGGNVHVAWNDLRGAGGSPDVYAASSSDAGQTYGDPVRVDDTGSATSIQNQVTVAAGGEHEIFAVWEDDDAGDFDIYLSKSFDGVPTFGTDRRVDDSFDGVQLEPSLAVSSDGVAYVAWIDSRSGSNEILVSRSAGDPTGSLPLTASPDTLPADGASASHVSSGLIVDGVGIRVLDGELVTASTTLGSIATADADGGIVGVQVPSIDATVGFHVLASSTPGSATVTAETVRGTANGSVEIAFFETGIFADGFESGDTLQWDATVP